MGDPMARLEIPYEATYVENSRGKTGGEVKKKRRRMAMVDVMGRSAVWDSTSATGGFPEL